MLNMLIRWNRERLYRDLIKKVKGIKVLDIGAGHGDWMRFIQKKGYSAHGVEVNEKKINNQLKGLTIFKEIPDNQYDTITICFML